VDGMDKLKGSHKVYRAHLMRIYEKIEELDLTEPATEEITSLVIFYIDKINCKAEAIQQLDNKIQSIIEGADETEQDTFESLEIQDTIIEKVVRFKCYLENSATTSAPPAPISIDGSRDLVQPASASRLPKLEL